jgi:protein-tyrosine-phosphatase
MAHAILAAEAARRGLSLEVYSAGVYDYTDLPAVSETVVTCQKNNTPPPKEESTWVGDLPLDSIQRFLVMEQHHADVLIREFGVSPDRVNLLGEFDPRGRGREIADPIGQNSLVYEESYKQIRDCLLNYLDTSSL